MKPVVILSRKEALRRAGDISKFTEWRLAQTDPTFPQRVRISERRIGYYEDEWEEC